MVGVGVLDRFQSRDVPASIVVKRRGGLIVMGFAGLLGAAVLLVAQYAGNLSTLVAAQFFAGAAWGCMMMSAISAALEIGRGGAKASCWV